MQYRWDRVSVALLLGAGIAGCHGGSGASSSEMLRNGQDVVVSGFITDGPIIGASVEVVSADDATVSQAMAGSTATFHALVPANTKYPVRLRAVGGTDLVTGRAPDFVLEALLTRPEQTVANLSPLTTVISRAVACNDVVPKRARLAELADRVTGALGMGYDAARFGNPASTPVERSNAAAFVLASEALGEALRRTSAAVSDMQGLDSASMATALGCDLADDGVLNGTGQGESRRIAATFRAAAAGVLVETVAKSLKVDGTDAMARLDDSMRQSQTEAGSVLEVETSPMLVQQTRDQLAGLSGQVPDDLLMPFLRLLDQTALANLTDVIGARLREIDADAFAGATRAIAVADDIVIGEVLERPIHVSRAGAPVVSLAASPASVLSGQNTRLSWAASEAARCWASGAWIGEQPVDGTLVTQPLTKPARYGLTCTGLGGTAQGEVAVVVAGSAPPAPPRVDLVATPTTVAPGADVTLSWTTSGADRCTAGGDWSGDRPLQGSFVAAQIAGTRSYSMNCSGAGGGGGDSLSVFVGSVPPPPPLVAIGTSIHALPAWIGPGGSTTLSWASSGATACEASGAWTGTRPASGSATISGILKDSTFSLSCAGPNGNAVASTTVSLRVARLTWRASEGSDGALQAIAGFKIFHGTRPGVYDPPVTVSDPAARSLEMPIAPGTHYFALASVDASGRTGSLSNEATKVVE